MKTFIDALKFLGTRVTAFLLLVALSFLITVKTNPDYYLPLINEYFLKVFKSELIFRFIYTFIDSAAAITAIGVALKFCFELFSRTATLYHDNQRERAKYAAQMTKSSAQFYVSLIVVRLLFTEVSAFTNNTSLISNIGSGLWLLALVAAFAFSFLLIIINYAVNAVNKHGK